MNSKEIQVFCPATLANLSCGFDVLGLALEDQGDLMTVRLSSKQGIRILAITGQDLPLEVDKNVAGVAAAAFLKAYQSKAEAPGIEIEIEKRIKAGSGIGSSAASSAGVVVAMNMLLDMPFTSKELVAFAMEGEALASGTPHADNVAPAIFGGITLVRSQHPLDVIPIPVPKELYACILHPQIEIKTADSRKILKTTISLSQGVRQWGNVGGLIAGLHTSDYGLISRSLEDCIVEPIRSLLIPGFEKLKKVALECEALGFGISGSGPSVFALTRGKSIADNLVKEWQEQYPEFNIPFEVFSSAINLKGVVPRFTKDSNP